MQYRFLVDTYETEILKVLSVWSMFEEGAMSRRPNLNDPRGRSMLEQMVHQCVSEDLWFSQMLGISVTEDPLPEKEVRIGFMRCYAENAGKRLEILGSKPDAWWIEETGFFEVRRSRAWVMTRRLTHTSHHRGQQTTLLRAFNRDLHSTYGPTADTGGLMQNHVPVVYAFSDVETLLREVASGGPKSRLPGPQRNRSPVRVAGTDREGRRARAKARRRVK